MDSEALYLALRTTTGANVSDEEREELTPWIEAGWARVTHGQNLKLTPSGWLRLDSLANHLTLLRSRSYI